MNRRQFLHAASMAAGSVVAGCYRSRPRAANPVAAINCNLAPVQISPDREIRTVVGLRPYRPSGFVVKAEKIGEKLFIHNYGHGPTAAGARPTRHDLCSRASSEHHLEHRRWRVVSLRRVRLREAKPRVHEPVSASHGVCLPAVPDPCRAALRDTLAADFLAKTSGD